jgi:hypothetical protein
MKKSHVVDHNFYNSRSAIKEWKWSNMEGRFFSEQFGTKIGRIRCSETGTAITQSQPALFLSWKNRMLSTTIS